MQTPPAYKQYLGKPFGPEIELHLNADEVEWRLFRHGYQYPTEKRDPFRLNIKLNQEENIEQIYWG